jgi:hypothetical protein
LLQGRLITLRKHVLRSDFVGGCRMLLMDMLTKAVKNAKFPTSKDDLLAFAQDHNANERVIDLLYRLPAGMYRNVDAVVEKAKRR